MEDAMEDAMQDYLVEQQSGQMAEELEMMVEVVARAGGAGEILGCRGFIEGARVREH